MYWKGKEWLRLLNNQDAIDNLDNFPKNEIMRKEGDQLVLRDTRGHAVNTPILDLNIVTTITEIENGKYEYTNELGHKKIIDVTGSVIENITEILLNEEVTKEIYEKIAAQGKPATAKDTSIQIDNGGQAVLNPMQIAVAKGGITPDKVAPGTNGTFLITNDKGEVKWVSATDESIKEILTLNQAITLLQDNKNGTLTYFNEACFDKDGKFIEGSEGSTFDSNTLRIVATADGKYQFYDGRSKDIPVETIDVAGTVVENINEILKDNTVVNEIYEKIAAEGKEATGIGAIAIVGGEHAVLNPMQISITNKGITPSKLQPGTDNYLMVTKNGEAQWVAASDDIIKEVVDSNETVTVLKVNQAEGTFVYYNEDAFLADGSLDETKGIPFDANTLRIKEKDGPKGKGIYDFYDGKTSLAKPLMTISTRANAIVFENKSNAIPGENVQDVIDNIIKKIEVAQGKPAALKGNGILVNGLQEVGDAVLKEMTLTIADEAVETSKIKNEAVTSHKLKNAAVTEEKIKPGQNSQILVTKAGKATWVPASDDIIKEVVTAQEKVTILKDGGNGTFTYYNENAVDKDGKIIGAGVTFNANTLEIVKNAEGKYEFYDGTSKTDPIGVIDVEASVIENITEILLSAEVKKEIYESVAAQGKAITSNDGSLKIPANNKAGLEALNIEIANEGVTEAKIKPGTDKYLLATKEGRVEWVPASDDIIKEIVTTQEKVTILKDEGNGTLTYYNENAVDKDGNIIGGGVTFDSNTLRIESTADGKFEFYDGRSKDIPVATIDVAGTVVENINEILKENTVVNEIYEKIAAEGKAVTSPDQSITVGGDGDKAVLNKLELSITNKGVTPAKIQPGTKAGQLLVTNVNGDAQWLDATDDVIKDLLKVNQAVTELINDGDGTFTYFNEDDYDADGNRKPTATGTKFSANTLEVKEVKDAQGKGTGVFEFYDGTKVTTSLPIATIDVAGTVIENITEILNTEEVKNEILEQVAANGQKMSSSDDSIAITGGDKAALKAVTINIQADGVKTIHIKDQTVTVAKINSEDATKGDVLTADSNGKASFQKPTESVRPAMQGDLEGDGVIKLVDENGNEAGAGENVLFGNAKKKVILSVNEGGIATGHLGLGAVTTAKIKDQSVTADKLVADGDTEKGFVATVNADGSVSYQALTPGAITSKGNIIATNGITASDNGTGKVLADVTLGLADGKVSPTKLTPSTTDKYLLATKDGKAQWVPATDAIIDDAVKENETITILQDLGNGQFVYKNEADIKNGTAGVTFDANTLTINEKLDTNGKETGVFEFFDGTSDTVPIATIDVAGTVIENINEILKEDTVVKEIYEKIAADGKAITSTDGSLAIPANNKAGLEGLNMGIAPSGVKTTHIDDKQVTAAKLVADGTLAGHVATVNADGTVSYKSLTSTEVATNAASLKTDGIIQVGGAIEQAGTLFKEATLSIVNKGITTAKLADGAVTNDQIGAGAVTVDKISAANEPPKRVMVIDENGVVKWGELDDIVTDAAGNLTSSDNIIAIKGTSGPVNEYGQNALFKDVVLSINDNSITNQKIKDQTIEIGKLSSAGSVQGKAMVMVTNGNGGFDYVDKQTIVQAGKDLKLGTGLEFTEGNGISAVLIDTKIGIEDGGISTAKLADGAITIAKMSSTIGAVNATENSVLTAKGDGTVEYKKLNSTAFEGTEANLLSDGSLSIPLGNKAVLKETKIGITKGGVLTEHIAPNAVTTDTAIKVTGGEKAVLTPMNISLNDGGVTTKKITSELEGVNALDGTVLTADGQGNVLFKKLDEVAATQGKAITSKSLTIPTNKAALQELNIEVAKGGIKKDHIAANAVTEDKIGTTKGAGLVLTSNAIGGAEFKTLGQVIGTSGKPMLGNEGIAVVGGENAALADVTISIEDKGVTEAKLANNAVSTDKIQNQAITAAKIIGEKGRQVLATDESGTVKWMDADESVLSVIVDANESLTVLRDNKNGKFTYFNEKEVDKLGNIKQGAEGTTFDANTLRIVMNAEGKYEFFDKSQDAPIATIDVSSNVIENITEILNENTVKEQIFESVAAQGKAVTAEDSSIKITDGDKAVLNAMKLSVANEGITTAKMKPGAIGQLLVTNKEGKVEWVDATDEVLEEVIAKQETVTLLRDNNNGTFTYFNEKAIDKTGNVIDENDGVLFDANTLEIRVNAEGAYEFYDKKNEKPIGVIDVKGKVVENITEILNENTVTEQIYESIAANGKKVLTDDSIEVINGSQAVLNEMTIGLKNGGVTKDKVAKGAITEDKLFAGIDKASYVPVVQADGTVKYQPMAAVVTGEMLTVDNSLTASGDTSKALLQALELKVSDSGIGTTHIQDLAVTANKISSGAATQKGAVLTADGAGKAAFQTATETVTPVMQGDLEGDESIAVVGGQNVLFGDETKKTTLSIKKGGIKGTHIAGGTVTGSNIAENTITANKLTAGAGEQYRVAVADKDGKVSYQTIAADTMIKSAGTINVTDGVSVVNGAAAVLRDVTLGLKDNSILASKLDAAGAPVGAVATVGANGKTVSYQPIQANQLGSKGDITTDNVIVASDSGKGKVLETVKLSIKDKGINTAQLADGAVKNAILADGSVTVEKISAAGVNAASVLVTKADGTVEWGELGDIVTDTAGNLTTDNIIKMSTNGQNTLLKDVHLSVENNSITRDKLSSKENGVPAGKDKILVSNDAGGFDLVDQTAVQVGGKDLVLGSGLQFTKGNGLNTVLVETTIDVAAGGIDNTKLKDGAVTVEKMSSGAAVANTVLTSKGDGKVSFEALSETAFNGKGANLLTDSSITVAANNQALLKEAHISIAEEGVETKHLKDQAVTVDKINAETAAKGTVLMAGEDGVARFQPIEQLAETQGKAIASVDGTLNIPANKAGLERLEIGIASGGVKNAHIADQQVTVNKIGAPDTTDGYVLTADGQGGAEFRSIQESVLEVGKELKGGTGIVISGGGAAHALLDEAIVGIKHGGVSELELADSAVTTIKIANKNVTVAKLASKDDKGITPSGQVLTADGKGGVIFKEVATQSVTKGELKGSAVVSVSDGKDALLKDVTLDINAKSINAGHMADRTITYSKIKEGTIGNVELAPGAVRTEKILDSNVTTAKIANNNITTVKIADKAVTKEKIDNDAVDFDQLKAGSVRGTVIQDKAVTTAKIAAGTATVGHVLTVESGGTVAFKAPTGSTITKANLEGSGPITVVGGTNAVLNKVTLDIKNEGIDTQHIKRNAVNTNEMADKAVTVAKIDSRNAEEGFVLTADGNGGATFEKAKGGGAGFFYAPSFVVDVTLDSRNNTFNVYDIYDKQYSNPISSRSGAKLNVYKASELDFFVVYYDKDVFENVSISATGVLKYDVKKDAEVTEATFFNVVMQLQ
ncbi:hypothetical protein AV926_17735 [Myroides marinus]|uniref:Uncharacterized protein n=1 Tax=Myroides marinus TaxID=703342 RepID=A0A163UYW4_9FLAO|nr:hypothetical protein [Myroides marinus]KZE74078.1 hypothetical protein AV926_17735 [Myroides marinus]